MLQVFKKSYVLFLLFVVAVTLASCKKSTLYKIINNDPTLLIFDQSGNEIKKKDYGNNLNKEVTIKIDLNAITKNVTQITREVSVNNQKYEFFPLNKEHLVTLNDKEENHFKIKKELRKELSLQFHYDFFTCLCDGDELISGSNNCLEGSKIQVKPKNLPEDIIIKINNVKQVNNNDLNFNLFEDTTITYEKIGEEQITDEQILENQLSQINLPLSIFDTPERVSHSFKLLSSTDNTITTTYKIKESQLPKGVSIINNEFVFSKDFNQVTPFALTIICELQRNTVKKTKEFPIKVVKDSSGSSVITPEILEQFIKNKNYFLRFDGSDNNESVKNDITIINPYAEIKLEYTILEHNEYFSYDQANSKLVFNKDNKITKELTTRLQIKATYNDEVTATLEITLKLLPKLLYETREHEITNAVTISPQGLVLNNKKVVKREVLDETVFDQLIHNKEKTEFVFTKIGKTNIYYKVTYEDNTIDVVVYTYNVTLPTEGTYINRYLSNLSDNYNQFLSYNQDSEVLKTPKVVGTDNEYLPDIVLKYTGDKLNDDKTKFEKKEIETLIDFTADIFDVKVYNSDKKLQNEELYTLNGCQFSFKEQLDDSMVYEIEYYLKWKNELLFKEYIKVHKGVNAYEDYQLRQFFRELMTYDYIYLQRNIKVQERKEVVKQKTLPSGIVVSYRDYNWSHTGAYEVTYIDDSGEQKTEVKELFDSEGNITKEQRFYQGSIYYRYFNASGSRRNEYKPVKFDGNHYTIDAKDLNYCYDLQNYIPVPDVQCAVFDVDSPNGYCLPYHLENEIKNIQIIGNGGISGKTIDYDGQHQFSKLAGAIHSLRARLSKVNYSDIISKDANGVLWASGSEININQLLTKTSFGYNIYYRNRMGGVNETDDIPMTRIKIEDSYFGETGGIGISIADSDRRHRLKDENISDYIIQKEVNGKMVSALNEELHNRLNNKTYTYSDFDKNKKEDRIKYSCDPSVEFKNTEIKAYVSTDSSLVKSFNLTDKIQMIQEYEQQIENLAKIKVLQDDDNQIKINAALFLINNNILDKPIANLSDDSGNVNGHYFMFHDCPRWDVTLNEVKQYYPSRIQYQLNEHALAKLSGMQVLLTTPGANFLSHYNQIDSTTADATPLIASHLTKGINNQITLPQNRFLQLIPIADFPLYNNGTENGKIYASFIVGYERI